LLGGVEGTCEGAGFCSFPDPTCDGGQRFEPNAGDGLAGTCVAAACGSVGGACCTSGAACESGGTCTAGTCEPCVSDIALGRRFACMLQPSGAVFCSGENGSGQLGIGVGGAASASPMQVRDSTSAFITDATAISAGREQACALRPGGVVWCWGAFFGDVANQVRRTDDTPLTDITQLRSGGNTTCGLDSMKQLWCWGSNSDGQLGDGTINERSRAALVLVAAGGAPLAGITSFSAGSRFMCATNEASEIWCWGENNHGQLGNGNTTTPQLSPVKAAFSAPSVSAGQFHVCAPGADGTLSCWGWSGHGRLGSGKDSSYEGGDALVPQQVLTALAGSPFTGVKAVELGGESCAITQDSHVWCWGDSAYGQTGTGAGSVVPVEVIDSTGKPITDVARLIAHYAHVCAQQTSGRLLCWGRNTEGTFGDGTFLNHGIATPSTATCPSGG
jgi:alpha-tubulin suppressor-like RCC1 family protein